MDSSVQYSQMNLPLVSVGLPVYSLPLLLRRALASLTNQSYKNLEIIISDDQSPFDEIRTVLQDYIENDPRIRYYYQEKNLGHFENHRFVFNMAKGDYFFWASEDDEWHEKFVEIGIRTLLKNPRYDAWSCTLNNIDGVGMVIREYPGFSRFTTSQNKIKDLTRYLVEPEVMGKANIFHGLFRRDALKAVISEYFFNDLWGSDYCFNLAFLARFDLIGTDHVLHHKRIIGREMGDESSDPIEIDDPKKEIFSLGFSTKYIREHDRAVRNTPYRLIVFLIMLLRLPRAILNAIDRSGSLFALFYDFFYYGFRRLKILGLSEPKLFFHDLSWMKRYTYRNDKSSVDVRWRMVHTHGHIIAPISHLRATLCTPDGKSLTRIPETPHYQFIKSLVTGKPDQNASQQYFDYIETYYPDDDPKTELEYVKNLVNSFQSKKGKGMQTSIVCNLPQRVDEFGYIVRIVDGVHRAAIVLALGQTDIKCKLLLQRI